ncbi:Synaptic vesicle membrane protein VAT-1 homolog-like, partial [Eschrichtius robustus]|nr:Synaptic vesicle membrane protein VAT-1 homolog-like [Eschrichtius robustus]
MGQAVAQLCSTVPNVTVFGTASTFKHEAIKDSVTHLFDRNADYVQEVKRTIVHRREQEAEAGQLMQGDVIGRGENEDPQAEYGYEEHQARSEEQRTGGSIGGSLEGSSNMVTGETKSFFSFAKSGVAMSHQSLPSSSLLSASSAASEALTDSLALQAPSEHLLFVVLCQAPGYHSE